MKAYYEAIQKRQEDRIRHSGQSSVPGGPSVSSERPMGVKRQKLCNDINNNALECQGEEPPGIALFLFFFKALVLEFRQGSVFPACNCSAVYLNKFLQKHCACLGSYMSHVHFSLLR